MNTLLGWSRPWAFALALLGLVGSAHAASASADATDKAFGALLAMPGAQPKEGGWIIPQEAARDEDALIAQLQRLKKEGADFNAMRHRGTLLAHAIRAGKERAALWLLRNGADPRNVLFDGRDDAYALARKYRRAAVATVLEKEYGFHPTPTAASPPATPNATSTEAPAVAPTREQRSVALLQQLLAPGAGVHASVEAQQAWRRYAATLDQDEFRSLFKDGAYLEALVLLTQDVDGGLEEALGRLPDDLVRRKAPAIAGVLAKWSFVTYGEQRKIEYTGASRSWPALWRRLEQPLDYDMRADLAAHLPPSLWPGLFASGYANHEAEVTGCLLAAVDLPGLKALWPDFLRFFVNAHEEAAGLVLGAYRIDRERSACYYGSSQAETAAKLEFLRANGVTAPVHGLRGRDADQPLEPALAAMVEFYSPKEAVKPRLVKMAPKCELSLDERWWSALVKVRRVGWGVPPSNVALVEVPGVDRCGLLVSGDTYPDESGFSDEFDSGPYRDPPLSGAADLPHDGEIWIMGREGIRPIDVGMGRGAVYSLRQVRDVQTGKRYLLTSGLWGAARSASYELPGAFEWQVGDKGPKLVPGRDELLVVRLLRQQCVSPDKRDGVTCPDLDPRGEPVADDARLLEHLRNGDVVALPALLDALGTERRAAYRTAIAEHDHARLHRLLDVGIPGWWTADEIMATGQADLSLEEKRRRIALLFADAGQLSDAFNADRNRLPESLGWLPRQDLQPILRLIGKHPDAWFDIAQHLNASVGRELACEIDRAQGFLCGGGVDTR